MCDKTFTQYSQRIYAWGLQITDELVWPRSPKAVSALVGLWSGNSFAECHGKETKLLKTDKLY